MSVDLAALVALAKPIAEEVGETLRASLSGSGPAISAKSTPTDLVTELDTWAERRIVDGLLTARPDDGVLGEEGAATAGTSGVTWCIDPIDGTVNFVHRLPAFCVSIAAMVEGRSVAGVVVSPVLGETYVATEGGGAAVNGAPLEVAEPVSVGRSVVGTGFGYDPDRRARQGAVVAAVISQIADIRRGGSAALDLCSVASGQLDAYWEVGLNPWDHAAGSLIAREAGATVTGLRGEEPSDQFILAASPRIWADLADVLRAAGADQV